MIYENQYIGAFIYLLGVVAGKENSIVADSINLLQQTPYDKTFSDLMAKWGGKNFIIEFKRSEVQLKEEQEKKKFIHLKEEVKRDLEGIGNLSAQCHFVCYAKKEADQAFLAFKRYIQMSQTGEIWNQKSFIEAIVDRTSNVGISNPEAFELYLKYLMKNSDRDAMNGLVVNISADGDFKFIVFNSYHALGLKLGLIKGQVLDQSIHNDIKPKQNKGQGRGM